MSSEVHWFQEYQSESLFGGIEPPPPPPNRGLVKFQWTPSRVTERMTNYPNFHMNIRPKLSKICHMTELSSLINQQVSLELFILVKTIFHIYGRILGLCKAVFSRHKNWLRKEKLITCKEYPKSFLYQCNLEIYLTTTNISSVEVGVWYTIIHVTNVMA